MSTFRRGWSVAIRRTDESEFLACAHPGILPAVHLKRRYAVAHKRELVANKFKCRVVRVRFISPEILK